MPFGLHQDVAADAGAPAAEHVAVEVVADVPGVGGGDAEGAGGEVDHLRVGLADAGLVAVDLDGEAGGQAVLGEPVEMHLAGEGVADDADGDAGAVGGVEEVGHALAELARALQVAHAAAELARVGQHRLPRGGRPVGGDEIAPELGMGELARGEGARHGVLPARVGAGAETDVARDLGEARGGGEAGEPLRPPRPRAGLPRPGLRSSRRSPRRSRGGAPVAAAAGVRRGGWGQAWESLRVRARRHPPRHRPGDPVEGGIVGAGADAVVVVGEMGRCQRARRRRGRRSGRRRGRGSARRPRRPRGWSLKPSVASAQPAATQASCSAPLPGSRSARKRSASARCGARRPRRAPRSGGRAESS